MNEVEIPLKITGIGAIKAELRELKGAIADATDPESIAKLSQRAGELKDKLSDANDAVNNFATGSKFEQVSNSLGGIKDSLLSLDFEEAQQKAQVFASALGNVNPKEIAAGFKAFTGVIKTMGSAFVKLGIQILANPIFLLVAVIIAIVAAIVMVLKYFGVLDAVLKAIMAPINMIIDGFKMITDALGFTSFAAEENAEVVKKTEEAKREAMNESLENRKKIAEMTATMSREEIAMMEELTGVQIDTSKSSFDIENQRLENNKASLNAQLDSLQAIEDAGGELTEEQIKDREKLKDEYKKNNQAIEENERARAKAIIEINQRQNDLLIKSRMRLMTDENDRAKAQLKLDQEKEIKELNILIRNAKLLGQSTKGFEEAKVNTKAFYAAEATKIDTRVADETKKAAEKERKENSDRQKANYESYVKSLEQKLKATRDSNKVLILATEEGTQARVTAEVKALQTEVDYMAKNAKAFKISQDQLTIIRAETLKQQEKLQEDFNKKVTDATNKENLAKAQNDLLIASTDEAKFEAKIKLLEAEAMVKLQNEELTAIEIKNINDQLAVDLGAVEKSKTDLIFENTKKIIDAEKLRVETALSLAAFELERFKGNKDEEIRLNNEFLAQQLAVLDAQKLAELNNLNLSETEKEAIREKFRQAKITAEEATAKKIEEIEDKAQAKTFANINAGFDTTKDALNAISSMQSVNTTMKLKNVQKGSKEEEKILKQQFEQQKKMQLAMAAMNGAQAILAILSVPDFTLGVASAIRIAGSIAATVASIATISSTTFQGGGSAPSPSDGGGGGNLASSTGQMATPNLFGSNNNANNVGGEGQQQQQGQNITVTAVVSETEMTNVQKRVNRIQQNAEL
jgi:hypothetical protein